MPYSGKTVVDTNAELESSSRLNGELSTLIGYQGQAIIFGLNLIIMKTMKRQNASLCMHVALTAILMCMASSMQGQDITIYNGLDCEISVIVTYGQTGCPPSPAINSSSSINLNNNAGTTIPALSGYPRIRDIKFYCGYGCTNYIGIWDCADNYSIGDCCDYHLDIQGSIESGELRIDVAP